MSLLDWSPQFCDKKIVHGTLESCMKIFKFEIEQYPPLEYGTHITSQKRHASQFEVVIKRFKNKEFYAMYTWILFSKQI